MRRAVLTVLFVASLVVFSGCLQPAPVPAPPAVTPVPTPVVTQTVTVQETQKQVNFTVTQEGSFLNITYTGGPDAGSLQSLDVLITNHDGTQVPRTIANPIPGATYTFPYKGVANAARVNIVGTFAGGYQQTVLMYYI